MTDQLESMQNGLDCYREEMEAKNVEIAQLRQSNLLLRVAVNLARDSLKIAWEEWESNQYLKVGKSINDISNELKIVLNNLDATKEISQ